MHRRALLRALAWQIASLGVQVLLEDPTAKNSTYFWTSIRRQVTTAENSTSHWISFRVLGHVAGWITAADPSQATSNATMMTTPLAAAPLGVWVHSPPGEFMADSPGGDF